MAVGSDEGVGVVGGSAVFVLHEGNLGDPLEVDLVDDATTGRDCAEVVEVELAPLEELVALLVAGVFDFEVAGGCVGVAAREVDLDRVVDDEVDGDQRVDLLGVATERDHGVAECGEVDDDRHAGEVLEDDAGGDEGDLHLLAGGRPGGEGHDVLVADEEAVVVAEGGLKEDADGEGEFGGVCETELVDLGDTEDGCCGAVGEAELVAGAEGGGVGGHANTCCGWRVRVRGRI